MLQTPGGNAGEGLRKTIKKEENNYQNAELP
jgi:hypothetical protein